MNSGAVHRGAGKQALRRRAKEVGLLTSWMEQWGSTGLYRHCKRAVPAVPHLGGTFEGVARQQASSPVFGSSSLSCRISCRSFSSHNMPISPIASPPPRMSAESMATALSWSPDPQRSTYNDEDAQIEENTVVTPALVRIAAVAGLGGVFDPLQTALEPR